MSDYKFSIDELLNEYSGGGDSSGFDLDSILNGTPDVEQAPYEPEMEKRRMELIKREIISGDYEHRYLGEDYKDVIDEENRRKEDKARKIAEFAKAMENREKEESARSGGIPPENAVSNKTAEFTPVRTEKPSAPAEERQIRQEPPKTPAPQRKHKRKFNKITEEDQDEFQRKYEELTRMGLGVKSRSERERSAAASEAFDEVVAEMERNAGPGRTFSEKLEEESPYGGSDKSSEVMHRRKTPSVVTDRSGLVSFTQNNRKLDEEIQKADDPLDSITNNSVDKLINEYEKGKTKNNSAIKAHNKSNTVQNVFDKLMTSELSDDGNTKVISGNADIMNTISRAKRERLEKTTNIPPVENSSFAEITRSLDAKIIRDELEDTDGEPSEENTDREKLDAVMERSKNRMKNFKFVGDEEESDPRDIPDDDNIIEDFNDIDDAPALADDIASSKASMIMRLLVLVICFLLSLYITVSNEMKAPVFEFISMTEEPAAYLFVNTIIGMVAAFSAYNAIASGMAKLLTLKANCDSFAALTSVITIALSMAGLLDTGLVRDGIFHEYIPVGIAALIFNTAGKLLLLDRTQKNFRYISGDFDHCAMYTIKNEELAESFTRGSLIDFPTLAAMRGTKLVSDFMKNSYSPDMADRFCRMFTPIVFAASLLVGVIGAAAAKTDYAGRAVYIGMSSFVGCLCFCSCFSMMLTVNLPMRKAAKKYNQMQGALIGFDAIEEFSETNSVIADASQFFPRGSVSLANIKIFSDTRIDEAIVEAASLACCSKSIMQGMFFDIIGGRTEMLNHVESYIYEDSMGLCGWINNKRVLLGNRKLMENHSIDGIPSARKELDYTGGGRMIPVYLSISGELSAMFIINLKAAHSVASAVRELSRNRIKIILRSVDSSVTVERMAQMFDISPETLKILPFRTHPDFENVTSYTEKQSATLACSGRFGTFASLIVSTKRIRGTVMIGIAIQAISILLGILLSTLLVLFKSYADLSAAMILLYNLIFTVIFLLINTFKRV